MSDSALKLQMEARGTVRNPDGTVKEIVLRAERPMTDDEKAKYLRGSENGDHDCVSR